jgi:hypothetical protein
LVAIFGGHFQLSDFFGSMLPPFFIKFKFKIVQSDWAPVPTQY